jgi:hypothetical protein
MDVSYQNSNPTSVIPAPDQTGAQATSLISLILLCVPQHMAECCIRIHSP